MDRPLRIWTVGHSTLPAAEFISLLAAHGIELLLDVRRFPSSRRHPHFNRERLAEALARSGIDYLHLPELGGRREPRPDSHNTGWREPGFRGYADYMETAEFSAGIARLLEAAGSRHAAIMCAEKPWRSCHRRLIADWLKAFGVEILHILDDAGTESHAYTPPAQIVNGRLSYAAASASQRQLPF